MDSILVNKSHQVRRKTPSFPSSVFFVGFTRFCFVLGFDFIVDGICESLVNDR